MDFVRVTKLGHIVRFSDTDLEIFIPFRQSGFSRADSLDRVVNENGVTVRSWLISAAHDGAGILYRRATYGK